MRNVLKVCYVLCLIAVGLGLGNQLKAQLAGGTTTPTCDSMLPVIPNCSDGGNAPGQQPVTVYVNPGTDGQTNFGGLLVDNGDGYQYLCIPGPLPDGTTNIYYATPTNNTSTDPCENYTWAGGGISPGPTGTAGLICLKLFAPCPLSPADTGTVD